MYYCGNLFKQVNVILGCLFSGKLKVTPTKVLNFFLARCVQKLKTSKPLAKPIFLVAEAASVCNLKCPFCFCGNGSRKLETEFMSFSQYKKIIGKVENYIIHVALFLYGEPLLNKDIAEMVEYAASKGILTTIHTNMNLINEQLAEDLIKAGLFRLVISLDGCTQATYQKYRVGGNISEVFRNIKLFVEVRKRLNKRAPFITWRYMVNKYNQEEIAQARKQAKVRGVDFFALEPLYLPDKKQDRIDWIPTIDRYSVYQAHNFREKRTVYEFCRLWDTLIVDCEGDAYFCCHAASSKKNSYGNLLASNLKDLWDCKAINLARKLVKGKTVSQNNIYCSSCRLLPKNIRNPKPLSG